MAEQQCDFTQCGDGKGVIHWIGTKQGAQAWANPAASGDVEVCMSSVGEGQSSMVADSTFTNQVCRTKSEVSSWVGVDLKSVECCPSIYTLAHSAGEQKDGFLRSWYFQASNDGVAWEDLDDRTDDQTMTAESMWAAYAITPTDKWFRFFRIKQKPLGNSAKTDVLTLCCFELYGKARAAASKPAGVAGSGPPTVVAGRGVGVQVQPPAGGYGGKGYGPYPGAGGGKGWDGGKGMGKGGGKDFKGEKNNWRQGTMQECPGPTHPPGATEFDWQFNGDRRGVLFHMGCGMGQHAWQNPLVGRKVAVHVSSLWCGRAEMICDHTLTNQIFFTRQEAESWVSIDLQTVRVRPTGYSFAHRIDMNKYFARNWEFQGSNDGHNWTCIYRHVNDETLNPQCLHASWAVNGQDFYRIFRVYMTGEGNSRGTNTLVLTCFDVYGTLQYMQ
eukprot:TRINITY_DN373_c0_g1_i3.p1 TRINITY_DN373_c0_g1~~TRINITY_DN373_c0_g1_i3.p1  ORF type:complete len:466 (+),score=143.62 TRINITY_DN373_c0_g1_i3:75-1400(+)